MNGAAGTYGSIASLPVVWLALWLAKFHSPNYVWVTMLILIIGWATVEKTQVELGPMKDWKGKIKDRDQNQIVIDEVWGMLFTFYGFIIYSWRPDWKILVIGLLLFRIFDAFLKFLPGIKQWDKLKSGLGVMMDDKGAGMYAAVCLALIVNNFPVFFDTVWPWSIPWL